MYERDLRRRAASNGVCEIQGFQVALTKNDEDPNGMKLASELLLDHLLTQFLPGFDHQWEALGSPFLDARLHAMRSDGVDDQRS
jgi:hypothetical protein